MSNLDFSKRYTPPALYLYKFSVLVIHLNVEFEILRLYRLWHNYKYSISNITLKTYSNDKKS